MIRIKYYHILFFLTTINLNSQKIADSLKGFKINDLEYLEMRPRLLSRKSPRWRGHYSKWLSDSYKWRLKT